LVVLVSYNVNIRFLHPHFNAVIDQEVRCDLGRAANLELLWWISDARQPV
jgi:hypothetical protein